MSDPGATPSTSNLPMPTTSTNCMNIVTSQILSTPLFEQERRPYSCIVMQLKHGVITRGLVKHHEIQEINIEPLPTATGNLMILLTDEYLATGLLKGKRGPYPCVIIQIKDYEPFVMPAVVKQHGKQGYILKEIPYYVEEELTSSLLNLLPAVVNMLVLLEIIDRSDDSNKKENYINIVSLISSRCAMGKVKNENIACSSRKSILEKRVTRMVLRNIPDENVSKIHDNGSIKHFTSESNELDSLTINKNRFLPTRNTRNSNKGNKNKHSSSKISELPIRRNPRRRCTRSQPMRNSISSSCLRQNNGSKMYDTNGRINHLTSESNELESLTINKKRFLPPRNTRNANKDNTNKQSSSQISELPNRRNPTRRCRRSQPLRHSVHSSCQRQNNGPKMYEKNGRINHLPSESNELDTLTNNKKRFLPTRNTRNSNKGNKNKQSSSQISELPIRRNPSRRCARSQPMRNSIRSSYQTQNNEIAIELKQEVPDLDLEHGSSITFDNASNPASNHLECEAFLVELNQEGPGTNLENGTLTINKILGPAPDNLNEVDGELEFYIKKEEDYYFFGDSGRQGREEALSQGHIKKEFTVNYEEDIPFERFIYSPDETDADITHVVEQSPSSSVSN